MPETSHTFDSDPPIEGGLFGDLINAVGVLIEALYISFCLNEGGAESKVNEIRSAAERIKTIREYIRGKYEALAADVKQGKNFEDEFASYLKCLDAGRLERFDAIVLEMRNVAITDPVNVPLLRSLAGEIYTLVKTKKDGQQPKTMSRLGLPYEDPVHASTT